jgi:hypothetical protein
MLALLLFIALRGQHTVYTCIVLDRLVTSTQPCAQVLFVVLFVPIVSRIRALRTESLARSIHFHESSGVALDCECCCCCCCCFPTDVLATLRGGGREPYCRFRHGGILGRRGGILTRERQQAHGSRAADGECHYGHPLGRRSLQYLPGNEEHDEPEPATTTGTSYECARGTTTG